MFKKLFFVLFLLASIACFSQDTVGYYTQDLKITSREKSQLFRLLEFDKANSTFTTKLYTKDSVLLQSATIIDSCNHTLNGAYQKFYLDGQKMLEGTFKNGHEWGVWNYWSCNGNKTAEIEFRDTNCYFFDKIYYINVWDSSGIQEVVNGNGKVLKEDYEIAGHYFYFTGEVKNKMKEGKWLGFDSTGRVVCEEMYENNKLILGKNVEDERQVVKYKERFVMPVPNLKAKALFQSSAEFTPYSEIDFFLCRSKQYSSCYLTKYTISKDGLINKVKNIYTKVFRDQSGDTESWIYLCGKFKPAKLFGKEIDTQYLFYGWYNFQM